MTGQASVTKWFLALPTQERERAWDEFLAKYAPLVLQVVQLFAHDQDQLHDCFVFACEKLKQDNLRRIRQFDVNGPATFSTWLRAVVRNLCLDWYRQQFGRPRLYRSIARLPKLEREIFRCIHLRGLGENEAFHTVEALYPSLTPSQFADCLVHIQQALSQRQSWLLATNAARTVSLSNPGRDMVGPNRETEIPDCDHDPELETSRSEYLAALRWALGHLSKQERLLVRLRFEQELTLEQIARITRLGDARAVQGLLHKAVARVRAQMTTHIAPPVSVKDS